jgi:hypothetical protein
VGSIGHSIARVYEKRSSIGVKLTLHPISRFLRFEYLKNAFPENLPGDILKNYLSVAILIIKIDDIESRL